MKDLTGCILIFIIIFCLGYILIEYDDNKFRKLCKSEPALPQCPKPEQGKTL